MRLQRYLNESIFDIYKEDIDVLYQPLISWVKEINSAKNRDELQIIYSDILNTLKQEKNNRIVKQFDSKILRSDICKIAHDIRPIKIKVGFVLVPTWDLFKDIIYCGIDIIKVKNHKIPIKPNIVKSNIRHEITHWIDDTLNKNYLTSIYKTQDWDIITKSGDGEIESTDFEIKAQIESVNEMLRRLSRKTKNILTFEIIVKIMKWDHKVKIPGWKKKMMFALKKEGIL